MGVCVCKRERVSLCVCERECEPPSISRPNTATCRPSCKTVTRPAVINCAIGGGLDAAGIRVAVTCGCPGVQGMSGPAPLQNGDATGVGSERNRSSGCTGIACCTHPRKALRGGISKVNFQETLSIFGDEYPQNGSKNEPRAPRTSLGCPH